MPGLNEQKTKVDFHLPIILSGRNLKERHHNLNLLVHKTFKENVPFQDIVHQPEASAADRIFKIDLASKYRNVEYIIKNLKDDDMLYVSRSLKCLWLLESQHHDKINPVYLEDTLYPEMIQPAVNKMRHWIQLHLKDTERCQEFYNYYKANFDQAFNYFWCCPNEFIMTELPNVIDKLSTKQLKIIFEACPSACKCYFEILPKNHVALSKYVKNANKYFNCVKNILKSDGNTLLDIVENYFDINVFRCFSPSATQYIMKYYRSRYDAKSELYVAYVLDVKTVAAKLTSDEAKELVLRLARAEYLEQWFSYKKVEPLIKRLDPKERSTLKKKIFVDQSLESKVKEWPYPIPKPFILEVEEQSHVFTDIEHEPYEYGDHYPGSQIKRKLTKRCCKKSCYIECAGKSPLDRLFDRYRFTGFEQTFYELSKNLLAESTIEGRLNMMLVLVSKSGGVIEQVDKFLKLMVERHRNEPTTLRAAVIRSLVKRGSAWRLPDKVWSQLLEFGQDVGLDGAETDPLCREGLHAVVLRHILEDRPLSPPLLAGFVREFTTFSEYKLNPEEIKIIIKRLPPLILSSNPNAFLDTLIQYKANIKDVADADTILINAAKNDSALVSRLYQVKLLRRELFHETFALKKDNAAYINALRYDTSPLENGKCFAELVAKERPRHDRFLRSLHVYFGEPGGLADLHRILLEETFSINPKMWFARSMSILLSNEQLSHRIHAFESERPQSKEHLLMCAGLRANANKTKPPLDIDALDWRWLGAKAVANKVMICRSVDRDRYVERLLEWRRTARIAVRLSATTSSVDTFLRFSSMRPLAALKVSLSLYLTKEYIEPSIWSALRSIIQNTDLSQKQRLLRKLSYPDSVSKNVLADYWVLVYDIFIKTDKNKAAPILCRLENLLPDVDHDFIIDVIKKFIENELNPSNFSELEDDYHDYETIQLRCLYARIIAKYLLLCKSETAQEEVIDNICALFFDALEALFQKSKSKKAVLQFLNEFIVSLKYTKVFLSNDYVSCLPVFDAILKRMRNILAVEEYFGKYVEIHLTMLYYKTLKQTMKLRSGIFDEPKKRKEAIEVAGRIFGNYLGYEIKELTTKYFKSIVDLYKVHLNRYLRDYFHFNDSRHLLVTFVVKGLLEANMTEAMILAVHVFQSEQEYYIKEPHLSEISKILRESNDQEIKFFL